MRARKLIPELLDHTPGMFRLLAAAALMSAAGNVFSSVMPDFLCNVLRVGGDVRGALETPRELPGFLQVVMLSALAGLGRAGVISLSFWAGAASFVGLALAGASFPWFVAMMILWSASMHLFVPLRDAMAVDLAGETRRGVVLGNVGASRSLGLIVGTVSVWLVMDLAGMGYGQTFWASAVLLVAGAILCRGLVKLEHSDPDRVKPRRFVVRREYRLYYVLAVLFGARKQIFLTFAPWLLVSVYGQRAPELALAMGVSAGAGLFSKPLFGNLIDRFGERTVLTWESVLVFLMCVSYAAAPSVLEPVAAVFTLYGLYVLDELLFSLAMARTTYLSRILLAKEDMVPTLGLGGTIDHAVSMAVPAGAGFLWVTAGTWSVFALASVVALVNLFFVRRMPGHREHSAA
ncbi:MFS transporter [Candidatus Fermentibacteria bacterium]|nr:MFS transporter [Candidatus Fermentibacteria bacterium]